MHEVGRKEETMMQTTPGPWCFKGQNSGLFEPQFRKYYSVYSIRTAPTPNMHADTVLENVAENCTEGDARLIAHAWAIPQLVEAVKAMQGACDEWAAEFTQKTRAMNWGKVNDAYMQASAALRAVKG